MLMPCSALSCAPEWAGLFSASGQGHVATAGWLGGTAVLTQHLQMWCGTLETLLLMRDTHGPCLHGPEDLGRVPRRGQRNAAPTAGSVVPASWAGVRELCWLCL